MPLVPTAAIVAAATSSRTAAVAFNVLHLETAEALAAAAERTRAPLILGISENCVRYHSGLLPITRATLAVAESSSADLSVHLDHLTDPELVRQGIGAGASSVMIDASALPYTENVAATAELAAWCHERGAFVEAELGEVGGKDGVHAPGARTDPGEALAFVRDTGVDALAVAVGSSHAMTERTMTLDKDLIAALRAALPVPLVLHGSSGVPDDTLRDAVRAGIVKVNIGTTLNVAYTGALREALSDKAVPRPSLNAARTAVADTVAHLLDVVGG
jgi:fructose-bisphosphate aldolase class II